MVVGLPGTGIGGLFYLFMTFWMPVHELYRLVRGRSSLERWKFIAFNWIIVAGILGTLWLTMLVFKASLKWLGIEQPTGALGADLAQQTNMFFAQAGWASAMSLVALVVIVQVLRFTIGRNARIGHAKALPAPLPRPGIDA